MLPNAGLLHLKRNPVDTCLSGFTRLFNKTQPQSYDLAEMGRYYRDNCSLLIDHWRNSHKTERNVRTASITQVRQPIYKSSVDRWRKYEAHLGPLLSALGDLVPVSR